MFQAQNRETKLVLEKLLYPPISLWRQAWQDCISQHNTKPARPRPRPIFLVSDRSCSKTDHITGLGERCELPSGVRGGALTAHRCFTIFSSQNGFSWHYNICLTDIVDHKKNEKFLTHSIVSQLLCIWWCCLMFFSIRNYSQSESGKWWSSLQGRGEVDGGNSTLGGIPLSSAGLRPHGPWHTGEIRGPWSYLKP